jgi:hypothetical protein
MEPRVKDFATDELRIERTDVPRTIRLDWSGASRSTDSGSVLLPFLAKVTDDAAAVGASLELHIEAVTLLNSSTIATFIRFIKGALDRSIPIALFFDARHRWQKLFADALCIFDRNGDYLATHRIA